MNYKKIFSGTVLAVSVTACSQLPPYAFNPASSFYATEAVDRFQIQQGLVVDVRSNLMWSRCLLGAVWNGYTCEGRAILYNWQQAQAVAKAVRDGGYTDWRMPTLEELKTLADTENPVFNAQIPYLNQTVFPIPNCYGMDSDINSGENACWHWSSTPIEGSEHYVWTVYFGYRYGNANDESDFFALRLVRNQR
jgi:hypothetical protein